EEDLPSSVAAEILDQLSRVAASLVGGGVDVDVRVLRRERDHLCTPGVTDVAAYDPQLRELERDAVEIRNGATGLGLAEGAGVANLETERDAELDALGIEGIVAAVVRGEVPQPGYDPEGAKPE